MRKLLLTLLALLALTLTGCGREKVDAYRVETGGHDYIVFQTNSGLSATHDPDCPCQRDSTLNLTENGKKE